MSTVVTIPSARLDLVLQTPAQVIAFVEAMPPADRAEVSPAWLAQVRTAREGDPWALGFSVVERVGGGGVGSCGFKGPPDADGVVELAYGTDAAHRGRGYATEVAAALTEFAFADARVRRVRAHTKADNGASARVLANCGFALLGEVMDPEDGPVYRWERSRSMNSRVVMSTGTLIITRPRQYADMLRHYRIVVDDCEVGRIGRGGELRVDLPCGEHRMVARMDWVRSNELPFGIRQREITEVDVGSNVRGWALFAAIYFATVGRRHWLYLRHRVTGFPVALGGEAIAG